VSSKGVGILGFGSCLPATVRGNDFWPSTFNPQEERQRRKNVVAVERSPRGDSNRLKPEIAAAIDALGADPFRGARLRHVIADDQEPSDLEAEACRKALQEAHVAPEQVDLVLVSSVVPDRLYPSNGPAIQAKCGLVNATAWSLDLGCASFQPQFIAASALVRTGTYSRILLVSSLAATRITDPADAVSVVFGDGAAAVVVGAVPDGYGVLGHWTRTDGSLREGIVHAPIVDGRPERRWDRVAGPIRLTSFDEESGKAAGLRSTEFCLEACSHALNAAGVRLEEVALFIANQSVGWLADACRRGLGLPPEKGIDTFAEVGNIGAAAIPFNLERAWRTRRLRDGDIVLLYSPGAGFTRGALVYRWIAPNQARAA
jgi:3-oxoacyl-[acyl-carrier-protein] synthase-3